MNAEKLLAVRTDLEGIINRVKSLYLKLSVMTVFSGEAAGNLEEAETYLLAALDDLYLIIPKE